MSREVRQTLRWFNESPDAGHPRCLCSYCGERIEARPEDDEDCELELNGDEGEPIRMWPKGKNLELRFHPRCLNECVALGLLDWNVGPEK